MIPRESLDFVKILDQTELRVDDEDESSGGGEVNRAYWDQKAPSSLMGMCDQMLAVLNDVTDDSFELKYQKNYIGLRRNGVVDNILTFTPKPTKSLVHVGFRTIDGPAWQEKFLDVGVQARSKSKNRMRLTLTHADWLKHRDLVEQVVRSAEESTKDE